MRKKLSLKEKLEKLSPKGPKKEELLLRAKKAGGVGRSEIDRMVSKIEHELDTKRRPKIKTEKIEPKTTIKNFEIPASKIRGISALTSVCDTSGKEHLSQTLYLKNSPDVELRWTVIRDPFSEEFAVIVREGLRHIKTQPLIFGIGVDDGVILASHREGYTMTLGSYDLKIGEVVEIFVSLMGHVEKRM